MDRNRRITLGAATLAVALGAGHLVQSGLQNKEDRSAAEVPQPTAIVPLAASAEPEMVPAFATAALTVLPAPKRVEPPIGASVGGGVTKDDAVQVQPAPAPMPVKAVRLTDTPPHVRTVEATAAPFAAAPALAAPAAAAEPSAPVADACPVTLTVTASARAMLDVALTAPCDGGSRVVVRHGGLAVTGRLSEGGTLFTAIPGMEPRGAVAVLFPDGATVRAEAPVDLDGVHRFAVQWIADDAFQVQAYENGAGFGMPGHVHADAPVGPGGWLGELGDASVDLPMRAEVYTFPAGGTPVDIAVEAAVTDATCDRQMLGEAIESQEGALTTTEITLSMPACDGQGGFLVLNNLAGGTTLAAAN